MKKALFLLTSAAIFALASCSQSKGIIVDGVTELEFASSDGEISWNASKDATEYGYCINDGEIFKTKDTSINIFDVVNDASATSLKVYAYKNESKSEAATLSFSTFKLATPNKGVVTSDPKTNDYMISWDEVENANKYLVSVNKGKFVTYHTNSFKPSAKGEFSIEVKCKQYVKDKSIVYLASEVSPVSETLSYLPGPALRNDEMNVINWDMDETTFDSYNLWIDGKKVRENVSSPLNLVTGENPILTKTGEYDIQIEAVKGKQSYWSNVQEEFGTSNINPNEIYSFDNRKFNKNIPSGVESGWTITDEKCHSEPYSMYVPTQLQVNMQKYANDDINDVDYRKVNKVSCWVYIPKIVGYSGTVKGVNLPPVIFDGWGEDASHGRLISFPKETQTDLPYEQWVQIHYEVENQYDNVIIFGAGAEITLDDGVTSISVPFYLDDICYDDVDKVDYDYKFKYDVDMCGGAWSNQPQKLSFGKDYANKEVEISMDICGTASSEGTHTIAFGNFDKDLKLTGMHTQLNRSYISSLEYQNFKFSAKLDSNGDFYTALYEHEASFESNETLNVYVKNVTCGVSKYASGTLVEAHELTPGSGNYTSILPIPTTLEAGTPVEVSMDIAIRSSEGAWINLKSAPETWATPIPTPHDFEVLTNAQLLESDDWRNIKFSTKVLNEKQIKFDVNANSYVHNFEGNYILLYFWGHASVDAFYYKEDSISIDSSSTLVTDGVHNGFYQSLTGLKTELAAGTNVTVEMDVCVTGTYGEWSQLYWVNNVYTQEGGEANNEGVNTSIKDLVTNGNGWHHISFEATVRNFGTLRIGLDYPIHDTSSYGNAVYLISMNETESTFNYKNVTITAK